MVYSPVRDFFKSTCHDVTGKDLDGQLSTADLNWEVELEPMTTGRGGVPKHFAAYRSDGKGADNGFIDVYGSSRKPSSNRETVSKFNEFCQETGLQLTGLGNIKNGRSLYAVADMPELTAKVGETVGFDHVGDMTDFSLVLYESHVQNEGCQVYVLAKRKVCTNGMTVPVKTGKQSISHGSKFASHVKVALGQSIQLVENLTLNKQNLSKVRLSEDEAKMLLISQFGDVSKEWDKQPHIVKNAFELFAGHHAELGYGVGLGPDYTAHVQSAENLIQAVVESRNYYPAKRVDDHGAINSLLCDTAHKQLRDFNELVGVKTLGTDWRTIATTSRRKVKGTQTVGVRAW